MSGTAETPAPKNPGPKVEMEPITFPLTLTETVDAVALRKVLKVMTDSEPTGYDVGSGKSQKTLLQLYLQKLNGNTATVTYDFAIDMRKTKYGRVYAAHSLGLQSFSRRVRNTIAGELYWDLDIKCCQPTIVQAIAAKYGWSCPALTDYIAHRDERLGEVMRHYGVVRDTAKELFNRELFLGGIRAWRDAYGVDPEIPDHPLAVAYLSEVRTLAQLIVQHDDFREYRDAVNKKDKRPKGDTGLDAQKATMAAACQTLEHSALCYAMSYLKQKGRPIRTPIFDGGLVSRLPGETEFPREILHGINRMMEEVCGISLVWVVKPLEDEPYPIAEVTLTDEEMEGTGKIDDLYAAREFVRMMGCKIDRDGEAMSSDGYRLQVSYVFLGEGYTVASNLAYGSSSFDARNPIFGARTVTDGLVVDSTLFYRLPFESGRWQAVGSVLWGEDDSDVAFHDSELFMINVGAMYRFGADRKSVV
jgi:hypothetical protein